MVGGAGELEDGGGVQPQRRGTLERHLAGLPHLADGLHARVQVDDVRRVGQPAAEFGAHGLLVDLEEEHVGLVAVGVLHHPLPEPLHRAHMEEVVWDAGRLLVPRQVVGQLRERGDRVLPQSGDVLS